MITPIQLDTNEILKFTLKKFIGAQKKGQNEICSRIRFRLKVEPTIRISQLPFGHAWVANEINSKTFFLRFKKS